MAIEMFLTDAFTDTKRVECMVKLCSIERNISFVFFRVKKSYAFLMLDSFLDQSSPVSLHSS